MLTWFFRTLKWVQCLLTDAITLVPYVSPIDSLFTANNAHQDLAWTGWKDSGKGQTLSKFGFDQFVKLKSYHVKDYPK